MHNSYSPGFADRQKTAAEARQALLAKLKPRPTVTATTFESRAERREAELTRVRAERAAAREAARLAVIEKAAADIEAQAAAEAEALAAKRGERKERKQLTKAEQKARRDARYAARKAR
jgi:hypothetical protein